MAASLLTYPTEEVERMLIYQQIIKGRSRLGFALIEGIVAMGVVGVAFVALYSGLTYGFARVQLSRENHRATQILVEKMETIRLYNWTQITDGKFVPENFEVSYYPGAKGSAAGVLYNGRLRIEDPDLTANYSDRVKKVTVELGWTTGKLKRERSLSTYVTEFGLHKSVY